MYAGHNQDCKSYYRIFDGNAWSAQLSFDWSPFGCDPGGDTLSYSNLWYMSAENRVYNFVRAVDTGTDIMVSSDQGNTWGYGGRITAVSQVGVLDGYYKYWGNGVDRIDFIATEEHPGDADTSVYHGYVKGGKSYTSRGTVIDDDITDSTAPVVTSFTQVFKTGTVINGATMTHAWVIDVQRYDDGTVAALYQARADNNASDPDHRYLYARFDGIGWKSTYLGKAGHGLYSDQIDYVGLAALHPNDPTVIFISTPIDPRDDNTQLSHHEIFRGVTCDNGATFTWTPVTQNSPVDNLRPIVPKWNAGNTALLWWRGTYSSAQLYDAEVVGLLDRP
jgi:hypothetical protein